MYSNGKVSVTLTSADDCFGYNVASNDIYFMEYSSSDSGEKAGTDTFSASDESTVPENVSEDSDSENTTGNRIRKLDVERKSPKELVLTADAVSDNAAYYIAVHKDATTNGKYAEAIATTVTDVQSYGITLDKSYAISAFENNPVITIPKDCFAEGKITAEKLILGGVFDGMGIDNVSVKDNKVELSLSGKASTDGDFSDNDITSVEKVSDTYYKINIRVDTSNGILGKNDGMIYGILSLADGSLMNTRGTKSDDTSCILYAVVSNGELLPFEFSSVLKKVQVILDATQLFGLPTRPVSKILDMFGDYAEKADTLTSLAQNCLGLAGIVDDREDVDKILDAINQLNDSIERLGQSISEIERMIQQSDVRMREAFDKQRYISYRDAWKSFTNGPMKDMTNIMDEFKSEYNNYLVTFMKNTGYSDSYTGDVNNGTLNVYLNTDNRGVELPSVGNDKFSLYYSETKLDKFVFSPEHMTQACKEENKGDYSDPIALILGDPAYKACLEKFNKDNKLSLIDREMRIAFETQAAAYAMSKIDAKKINTVYNNFMSALNDDDLMLGNTMNIYISMLSCFYNFRSEAKDSIIYMQNFLTSYTIRATSFASYASWFNSGYDRKSNPILTQYETAMKMLEKDYLHDTSQYVYTPGDPSTNKPSGYMRIYDYYDWSYVVNDKVRVIMKSVEGDKYSGNKNNLVQSDSIQLMSKRFETMQESGRTAGTTFGGYLISSGAVPGEYKDMINDKTYFATDIYGKNDGTIEGGYTCTGKYYPDSTYCELGQTYDISGSFGNKGKASSKYINGRNSTYMTAYSLGNITADDEVKISTNLYYREEHFWWRIPESYTFSKTYVDDYALFRQGHLNVFADYTSGEYSAKMAKLYKHDTNLYNFTSKCQYVRTDNPVYIRTDATAD